MIGASRRAFWSSLRVRLALVVLVALVPGLIWLGYEALLEHSRDLVWMGDHVLVILLVLAVGVGATWIGGRIVITRPIEALVTATTRLAAGDLTARSGVGTELTELGRLGRLLDEMAASLERRTAELGEAEAKYRALVEQSLVGVYVLVEDGFAYFNRAGAQAFGYRPEEIAGRLQPLHLIDPADRPRLARQIEALFAGRVETIADTFRGLRKDGASLRCELFGRRVVYQGRPAIIGTLLDVTERARAEEALRRNEAHFRALIEHATEIITVVDGDGTVRYASPAVERVLGYRPDQLVGHPVTAFVHPEDAPQVGRLLRPTVPTPGAAGLLEFRFRHRDGSWQVLEGLGTNLLDEPAVAGVVINARDVTDRRRTAEELERQRDALLQAEKVAAMGHLLAGVAHELNNPLSVLTGQTELLRAAIGEGPLARRADHIAQAADRCARIVNNFLALARQHEPVRHEVWLNQVVQEALELLAYPLRLDGVEVALDLAPGLPMLWADPHQLHQVMVNLTTNAHQAMRAAPAPRRLTLGTRLDEARHVVRLTVADTGPGVPPAIQSRIFEPFFTTKPPGQGTGLGLSLCQSIAQAHGGGIWLDGGGPGATFVVELPLGSAPEGEADPAPPAAEPLVRGRRILLVEDEPDVAAVIHDFLASDQHRVEIAPDGAAALERLREGRYDLVVSDVRMPECDGIALYREIERRYPDLKRRFVFLTGDTLSPEVARSLAESGAPILNKPLSLAETCRVVRRALRDG